MATFDPEIPMGDYNTALVRTALTDLLRRVEVSLGPDRKDIIAVVRGASGRRVQFAIETERGLRILRFAVNRAIETL